MDIIIRFRPEEVQNLLTSDGRNKPIRFIHEYFLIYGRYQENDFPDPIQAGTYAYSYQTYRRALVSNVLDASFIRYVLLNDGSLELLFNRPPTQLALDRIQEYIKWACGEYAHNEDWTKVAI